MLQQVIFNTDKLLLKLRDKIFRNLVIQIVCLIFFILAYFIGNRNKIAAKSVTFRNNYINTNLQRTTAIKPPNIVESMFPLL